MKSMQSTQKKLWCLFIVCICSSQAFSQPSLFSFNKFTNDKGDTLNYRLLYPDANPLQKYPLVIFLHGSGERGNDNDAQLKWGVPNFATAANMSLHPAIVIAPQCPLNMSWANLSNSKNPAETRLQPTPTKPMELVIALIHQVIKTLPVDSNRIYITGLSSGGHGTYEAIERYPRMFAAAVPVCGEGDASRAASIAHIPIWIFHGSEDSGVNPMYSLDMITALAKAGSHAGLTFYPGVGHFAWLAAYSDPLMLEWLFRQHR